MRCERVLPCAASRFCRLIPRARVTATRDELLDRPGEAVFAVAVGDEIRCPLHLRAGVAYGDTETTPLEHRDVVTAVADGGYFG